MITRAGETALTLRLLLARLLLSLLVLPATATATESLRLIGDLRSEYAGLDRRDRDGSHSDSEEFRARVRLGVEASISPRWSARLRAAGRFSSAAGGSAFFVRSHAPTPTGLVPNQATLDEFNLAYRGEAFSLRFGRLQTKVDLPDLMAKSLSRKDSAGVEVSWTDGVELRYGRGDWQQQLILQHNARAGTSNPQRPPLSFDQGGSRVSYAYGVESTQPWGPLTLRGLHLSYLPDALATHGPLTSWSAEPAAGRDDYLALNLRAAAVFPRAQGGRFMLAGEVGRALQTPSRASLGLGDRGEVGGTALQLSANWLDLRPGHDLALLYGRAEAGWLLSPDFVPNMDLQELRYQWTVDKHSAFEFRLRRREDLGLRTDRPDRRIDKDFYVRYTYKL